MTGQYCREICAVGNICDWSPDRCNFPREKDAMFSSPDIVYCGKATLPHDDFSRGDVVAFAVHDCLFPRVGMVLGPSSVKRRGGRSIPLETTENYCDRVVE